ncbi:putative RNA-binding protein C25G10.01 [Beauveria bassiana]|uniref:Putative RNA-binding protein C25G10.01 n=1 Tax=Beauveria bassiana TaxID=176275 RepID=A0A2N6NL68_BEABA|nr:putative RNA-binding protein C25G10.01 [Beauveria bassiana]
MSVTTGVLPHDPVEMKTTPGVAALHRLQRIPIGLFKYFSQQATISADSLCQSGSKETSAPKDDDDGAVNPGSNLFVTGIHPRLSEAEVTKMFEKYGDVEKCQIMKDPHSKESRGFGFVKMVTPEQADAAREGLQGEVIEGRTLSIEKARRARPRTPTPGKYFGPPKRGLSSSQPSISYLC